jgi:hypothetical protein
MGQTHFDNFHVPADSLYKPIEAMIKGRAQGRDGVGRMPVDDYASTVADAIIKRTKGRFWYGEAAERVKMSTTATGIPQDAMVSNIDHFLQRCLGVSYYTISRLTRCRTPALLWAPDWRKWQRIFGLARRR